MPAVVTFWQMPEEEVAFLDFLETTGDIVALPAHWVESENELIPLPIRSFITQNQPSQLDFGLRHHLKQVRVDSRQHEGRILYSGPNSMETCLIGYVRPQFRAEGVLGQSNLSAYWTCLDRSQGKFVEKDPAFVQWGKKIFAWVRKHTPAWHHSQSYRATTRVKEAIENSKLSVEP